MYGILTNIITFSVKFIIIYFLIAFILSLFRKWYAQNKKSIMIVLGSGGHTAELLIMLKKLNLNKFEQIIFVYSHNDLSSLKKINETLDIPTNVKDKLIYQQIYRSRNVGQSYFSSIFTTIFAFIHSCYIIFFNRPNLVNLLIIYLKIVTNGPGVSLPLCYIGYIFKKLFILIESKILFIESFCRTESISLSGKLLQPICDK
ncbi:hypothetical protein GW820_06965 [archaeon]|nr:hypothetical protein [archaeon]